MFFFIISSVTFSQNDNSWKFRIVDYLNFSSSISDSQNPSAEYFQGINTLRLSNSIGLSMANTYSEKISLGFSLNFAMIGDKSLPYPADPMRGFLWSRKYRTTLYNAEIPLFIEYLPTKNLITQFGVSAHYSIKRILKLIPDVNNQQRYDLTTTSSFSDKFDFSLNLGFGIRKTLNNYSIILMPYTQFYLRKIKEVSVNYADYLPIRNFYSVGIYFAFQFN